MCIRDSPITVPPPKEICRALGKLSRAACVVLVFDSVAILIPILPASPEKIAPITKAGIINILVVSTALEIKKRAIQAAATKIAKILYSAFKKAKAPSLMLVEIVCIFLFPGSCLLTQRALKNIKIKPDMARAIGI